MPAKTSHALGIDLGGTTARVAVVSTAGERVATTKATLDDRAPHAVVRTLAELTRACLAQVPSVQVDACGVGAAAQLEGDTGLVRVAPNLGWRDVALGQLLSEAVGRPVRVFNDLSAAAWGELKAGAALGARDVLVVFVGTGVGSAIIAGGKLLQGARGAAGELGHVKVETDGRACGCGERGCLEAYAGGHHLIAQMQEAAASTEPTALRAHDAARLTPALLEALATSGDAAARRIYDRAAQHLGFSIANALTLLNPEQLVLGGGVLSRCPALVERIRQAVQSKTAWVSRRALKISTASLGDDSGLVGAALLALE